MKKYLTKILILSAILIPLAFTVNASYKEPTAPRPTNTNVDPVYVDSTSQTKPGNVTINGAFYGLGNNTQKNSAVFMQDVFIPGSHVNVLGKGTTAASTLTVGSDLKVSGSLITNFPYRGHSFPVQSDKLIHSPNSFSLAQVCAQSDGTFVLCN